MVDSILVPMDGSPKSDAGLQHALSEFPDADVTVLHVMTPFEEWEAERSPPTEENLEEWYERSRADAEAIFETAESLADTYEGTIETVLEVGEPWREIVTFAETNDIDIVVMGSHGRDEASSGPLGSVAETVMRRSPTLVSIVR
jgi:nucleotide-binding universal stress UspA family protein